MNRHSGVLTDWNGAGRARGHNARKLGYCRISTQYRRNRKGPEERKGIRIASLNIRLGRAGGLEEALRDLHQGNVNVRVLQEAKLTRRIHTLYGAGCSVWATHVERRHQGVCSGV